MRVYFINSIDYDLSLLYIKDILKENNITNYINYEYSNVSNLINDISQDIFFNISGYIINDNNILKINEQDIKRLKKLSSKNLLFIISDIDDKLFIDNFLYMNLCSNLKQYIKDYLKLINTNINDDVIDYLLLYSNSFSYIKNMIDVLVTYDSITIDNINKLFNNPLDNNLIHLINYIIEKDVNKSYKLFLDLLNTNCDIFGICPLLINKLIDILSLIKLKEDNKSEEFITSTLNITSNQLYYLNNNITKYKDCDIISILDKLYEIELNYKLGNIDYKIGIKNFILGI